VPVPVRRFEAPPPLDIDTGLLHELLHDHLEWESVAAEIPVSATLLLWFLTLWDAVVTAWLVAVVRGSKGCSGHLCTLTTIGGNPTLTLSLAAGSLIWLAATSMLTRGFTRGTAPILVAVSASAGLAAVAVIGTVLLVFLVLAVLGLLVFLVVMVTA
jgi:hypothetical protein